MMVNAKRQGKPLLENPTADQINILGKKVNAETINFAGPRASDLTQGAKDRATRAIRGMNISTSKDMTKTTFNLGGILLKENTLTDPVFGSVTKKSIRNTQEVKDNLALGIDQDPNLNKMKTVDEWVKAYSDDIELNKNITADNEIIRPVNEPGILGKYSTDETIRTHASPFISDKSGAVREAEIIIMEGFNMGKSSVEIESTLANMFSRYATTSAKKVKTSVRSDGFYNAENIGLGTDVGSKGVVAESNFVENILSSMSGVQFKEANASLYPANMGQLEAIGKVSTYGKGTGVPVTTSSKTNMPRYWEIIKQQGGGTRREKGNAGEEIIKSGTSTHMIDPQEFLVSTQHDFVRINKKGDLVGNPQLGLSKEVNDKKIANAMDNILGPIEKVGNKWTKKGDRVKHFGYTDFKNKYNAGKLKAQNGVVPKRKLPAKLSTFKSQRKMTDKDYADSSFEHNTRTSNPVAMKKFVDGDFTPKEYTGEMGKDSLFTKQGFEDAGGGMERYNAESLPYSLLGREFKITSRPRISPIIKPVGPRSSWTPWTPKSIIEKDESLVGFNIKKIRGFIDLKGKDAVSKRISKPKPTRRLTGDSRGDTFAVQRYGINAKKIKEKKPTVYEGPDAFRNMYGDTTNSLVNDPMTGIPDNTLVDRGFRMPPWAIGGGDTTRVGGGTVSKGKPTWMEINFSTAKPPTNISIKSIGKSARGKKHVGKKVRSVGRSFSKRTKNDREADARLFDINYNIIEDIRLKKAFLQL